MATRRGTPDDDTLLGTGAADVLLGLAGHDRLRGGNGDDTVVGGAGHDFLHGGLGVDRLHGGADDDTYVIDDAREIIKDAVDGGFDSVRASISYSLGIHQERLLLSGRGRIDGPGNDLIDLEMTRLIS